MVSHVGGGRCGEEVALRGFPALFPQRGGGGRAGGVGWGWGGAARPHPEPGPRRWARRLRRSCVSTAAFGDEAVAGGKAAAPAPGAGGACGRPRPGFCGGEAELWGVMVGGVFFGLTVLVSPPDLSFSGVAALNQVTTSSMQQDRLLLVTQET